MKQSKKHAPQSAKASQKKHNEGFSDEASSFSFLAGYTSWGFPYGLVIDDDEDADTQSEDEELPF